MNKHVNLSREAKTVFITVLAALACLALGFFVGWKTSPNPAHWPTNGQKQALCAGVNPEPIVPCLYQAATTVTAHG